MSCYVTRLFTRYMVVLGVVVCFTALGCRNSAAGPAARQQSSSSPSQSTQQTATRVSWSGKQSVNITDPQFGMTAMTAQIPSGWKFIGQIVSPPGCHSVANSIDFTALAQDGITAIATLPAVQWTVTPAPGRVAQQMAKQCPPLNIDSPSDFLVKIAIPNMHPGARVESVLPLDADVQASLDKTLAQLRQQASRYPPQTGPSDVTLNGTRVRVQYTRSGQPVEEMIAVALLCNQMPNVGKTCKTFGMDVDRAPLGQLDAMLAQPSVKSVPLSIQVNPVWNQRLNQKVNTAFKNFEGQQQAETNQIMANARAQDAQRAQSTANALAADRANQAAIDSSAHNTVNYALDQKDYTNPATGQTITASSEYNHQWVNSSGDTLVQTNDPNMDPNGSVDPIRESWTELVPK